MNATRMSAPHHAASMELFIAPRRRKTKRKSDVPYGACVARRQQQSFYNSIKDVGNAKALKLLQNLSSPSLTTNVSTRSIFIGDLSCLLVLFSDCWVIK